MIYNIDGKKFDTDKAEYICSSKMPYKDSGYEEGLGLWHELYRTQKGNWVMVSVSCWQGSRNTAYIISEEKAQQFMLEYADSDDIKKYCANMEEI